MHTSTLVLVPGLMMPSCEAPTWPRPGQDVLYASTTTCILLAQHLPDLFTWNLKTREQHLLCTKCPAIREIIGSWPKLVWVLWMPVSLLAVNHCPVFAAATAWIAPNRARWRLAFVNANVGIDKGDCYLLKRNRFEFCHQMLDGVCFFLLTIPFLNPVKSRNLFRINLKLLKMKLPLQRSYLHLNLWFLFVMTVWLICYHNFPW